MGNWYLRAFDKLTAALVGLVCAAAAFAQSVSWVVRPEWDSVEMLGENLLRVSQAGRQGVFLLTGGEIIPFSYHQITNVSEGRFLVLDSDNKLISLWDDSGLRFPVAGNYTVDRDWPYYSGGMLVVRNEDGLRGFLNASGSLAIQCKYATAFPFLFGKAAVSHDDESWEYIATDGKRARIKVPGKKFYFASSFTQMDDTPLSLVCTKDKMYLIDSSGEVVSNALISKGGQPLLGAEVPSAEITAGSFTVRFNPIGEIVYVIKGGKQESFAKNDIPGHRDFPDVDGLAIVGRNRVAIGDNTISTIQGGRMIPVSSYTVLVEEGGKWGMARFDSWGEVPSFEASEALRKIRLDHATGTKGIVVLRHAPSDAEVYMEDSMGNVSRLSGTVNGFEVPMSFRDGKLVAKLGLASDGFMWIPKEVAVIPGGFNKAFSVSCPASAMTSANGWAYFRVTVKNTSTWQASAPFNVYVNGNLVENSGSLAPGESISVPVSIRANLGDKDTMTRALDITISEIGCPDIEIRKTVNCIRELKRD